MTKEEKEMCAKVADRIEETLRGITLTREMAWEILLRVMTTLYRVMPPEARS
jgi:hypothetical protein